MFAVFKSEPAKSYNFSATGESRFIISVTVSAEIVVMPQLAGHIHVELLGFQPFSIVYLLKIRRN